jgi:hypothetical protein
LRRSRKFPTPFLPQSGNVKKNKSPRKRSFIDLLL